MKLICLSELGERAFFLILVLVAFLALAAFGELAFFLVLILALVALALVAIGEDGLGLCLFAFALFTFALFALFALAACVGCDLTCVHLLVTRTGEGERGDDKCGENRAED